MLASRALDSQNERRLIFGCSRIELNCTLLFV